MSGAESSSGAGTVLWHDLTARDADRLRGFYEQVVGWRASPVDMGGYQDFNMTAPGMSAPVAGICHARGTNADLPPQWLMYVVVESVERAAAECGRLGGRVLSGPRAMSGGRLCVIEDPAGAVCALFEPPAP